MKTIEIIMLRRAHVTGIGVCEEKAKTPAEIGNAVYLVSTKHAKYAADKDKAAGSKFVADEKKAAEAAEAAAGAESS